MACAAPGVTPVDSSEKGAPVCELIWPSVLGEPLVACLQEPMPGKKSLEYAMQATASIWMPFEHGHNIVSGDVDSFGMAPLGFRRDARRSLASPRGASGYDVTVVNAAVVPTSDCARTG